MEGLQHRNFDLAQTSRWNYLHCTKEQRNLLNLDIDVEDMTLCTNTNSGRTLISSAKLSLFRGRKYGLVGRTGVGKTTLLQHIADHKIMGIFDHLRVVLVDDGTEAIIGEGEAPMSVFEYLLSRHASRVQLLQQLHEVLSGQEDVDVEAFEAVCDRLRHIESDAAESRASKVLSGLGIPPHTAMTSLSGGWRHRAALATALFLEADILLLDEPTNHLDIRAIVWLEEYLKTVRSTVVAVSHDYEFLDSFTTDIVCLEQCTLKYYKGNFSAYVFSRQQQLMQHKAMYRAQELRRSRLQKTIDTLQARASNSKYGLGGIRSRQQQLKHRLGAALEGTYWKYSLMGPRPEILAPEESEPLYFEFPTDVSDTPENATGDGDTLLIRASDVTYSFQPGTNVFPCASLELTLSSRVALIGRNGTGKTTFLRLLMGELQPSNGFVLRWEGLRTGYFSQHTVKALTDESAPLTWIKKEHPQLTEKEARNVLGSFGIVGIQAEEASIKDMSDGERARVAFASLVAEKPHLLILDEPTSHLDAETKAALVAALELFEGAVVVASHDRTFVDDVCSTILCMDPEQFGPYSGSFADYKQAVLEGLQAQMTPTKTPTSRPPSGGESRSGQRQVSVPQARRSPPPEVANVGSSGAVAVKCRHCGGDHFTHACTQHSTTAKSLELSDAQHERALIEAQQRKDSASRKKLPPTKIKAEDGKGDWTVAVSKSTKKRIQSGK